MQEQNAHRTSIDTGCGLLLADREPPIGWLIFNNPARRNAVSLEMWQAIPRALAAFAADPQIKVVIVTGAGDKAFVSGADISQFEKSRATPEDNDRYKEVSAGAQRALAQFEKPMIAMIRGYCIGGGMVVALSCDIRIGTLDARFGIPAARLGLGYAYAGVERLMQTVGPTHAREMLFTAKHYSAEDAVRMGLINRAVSSEDLDTAVRETAFTIAGNAPLTIRACKLAMAEALKDSARRDIAKVDEAVRACFASEDYTEGRRAFMEKRPPQFNGR